MKNCDSCKWLEEDYDVVCINCRDDDGLRNDSRFEPNDEFKAILELADIGSATLKAFNLGFILMYENLYSIIEEEIETIEGLLEWAEGDQDD